MLRRVFTTHELKRDFVFFFSAHELLSAFVLAVFFFFLNIFLCICVFVLYHLVVRTASVDGCLCLSGSLPLIFLYACAYFEANKYDDDDDEQVDAVTRCFRWSRASVSRIYVVLIGFCRSVS